MHNHQGRILTVDLSSGVAVFSTVDSVFSAEWLGGRGFGTALLAGFKGCSPFLSKMPVVFAVGRLSGSGLAMTGRSTVTGCSPLTGGIITVSAGGQFAAQLSAAGIDALVITGRADQPVLLEITPAGAKVVPAAALWGFTCPAVFSAIEPEGGVAAIGPAGESGVRFASIETRDGGSFDRGGLGAVLGDKRLKAIHLKAGDAVCEPADKALFDKAGLDMMRLVKASPFLFGPFGIRENGTTAFVDLLSARGMLPGANFKRPLGPAAASRLNSFSVNHCFEPVGYGCADCLVACRRRDSAGKPLPDYDAVAAFGAIMEDCSLDAAVSAFRSCIELGLDPVSAAGSIACRSEITGDQVAADHLPALLKEIAGRTGAGELLSMGAFEVAAALGSPTTAMTVKGLELPPYDPRGACALALAYAVSPHGGTHLPAWPIAPEVLRKPVPTDPSSFDGKARIVAAAEESNAVMDCMIFCRYASVAIELEEVAALYTAFTGEQFTARDLKNAGRRIIEAELAFNRSNGVTQHSDSLPERFFSEPAGLLPPLDRSAFELEIERYHRIRSGGLL